MQSKCVQLAVLMTAMAVPCGAIAGAQTAPAPNAQGTAAPKPAAESDMVETDAGLSVFRTFTEATQGNGTLQTPANGYGAMAEFRHIQSPLIGYELSYSFNQANQAQKPAPGACGFTCNHTPETLTAVAHQVGLDWIVSMKRGNISPFAVGGLGFYIAVPRQNLPNLNTIVRIKYTGGGGLDVGFLPRAGLRVQYREEFYKAPDMDVNYGATDKFTRTGEAMVGVYFHL